MRLATDDVDGISDDIAINIYICINSCVRRQNATHKTATIEIKRQFIIAEIPNDMIWLGM